MSEAKHILKLNEKDFLVHQLRCFLGVAPTFLMQLAKYMQLLIQRPSLKHPFGKNQLNMTNSGKYKLALIKPFVIKINSVPQIDKALVETLFLFRTSVFIHNLLS